MMPEWEKSESQNKTGIKLMKVEKDATDSLGKTLNSKHKYIRLSYNIIIRR